MSTNVSAESPLLTAVVQGNLLMVRQLLGTRLQWQVLTRAFAFAVHMFGTGQGPADMVAIVDTFLKAKQSKLTPSKDSVEVLQTLAINDMVEGTKVLVEWMQRKYGPARVQMGTVLPFALYHAINRDRYRVTDYLLATGLVDVNGGGLLLVRAALEGNTAMVRALRRLGADPRLGGAAAMATAAEHGHVTTEAEIRAWMKGEEGLNRTFEPFGLGLACNI